MSLLEGYFTDTKALLQRHLGDLLATLPRPYGDLNAIFLLLSYYFPIIFLSLSRPVAPLARSELGSGVDTASAGRPIHFSGDQWVAMDGL
jgi:hypothetical protein